MHGYDVIDPQAAVRRSRRRARSSSASPNARATPALGSCSTWSPTTWAADDANRYWADETLRDEVLRHRARDGDLPPVLRHRRARRGPPGRSRRVRRDPRARDLARTRGPDRRGCGSTIRTAWLTRPGTWRGCARPASSGCGSRRSSIPANSLRDWPVSGTVGYGFLNDVCAVFVDPAAEDALTSLWESGVRRPAPVQRARARGEARAGARPVLAGRRAPRAGRRMGRPRDARPRASRRCRSTGRTSSRGRGGSRTPTGRHSRASTLESALGCCSRSRGPPSS